MDRRSGLSGADDLGITGSRKGRRREGDAGRVSEDEVASSGGGGDEGSLVGGDAEGSGPGVGVQEVAGGNGGIAAWYSVDGNLDHHGSAGTGGVGIPAMGILGGGDDGSALFDLPGDALGQRRRGSQADGS